MKKLLLSFLLALTVMVTSSATVKPEFQVTAPAKFGPDIISIDFVPNSGYPFEAHATLSGTTTVETQYYVHIVYYTNPFGTTTYSLDYCLFDVNPGYSDGWYRNADSGLPTCYGIASWYVQFVYP